MEKINYEPVIGLEVHVELKTISKMFCGCPNDWFGKEPNTQTCPVCLGLPGALPVPNKKAIEWCIKLGMALNCQIPEFSKFDRKNYFYPDLPKGYQISQYDKPFATGGSLGIRNQEEKIIRIRRVHLEEDTGKLLHATVDWKKVTLIDFNRSGVPLVEIVTEPDIHSSEEAKELLKKLHQIIRYLGISDADMEKGSMRLEPNISVRMGKKFSTRSARSNNNYSSSEVEKLPSYKVEVKNINSFNFAKRAIDYEVERQKEILEGGETPKQETRGWDEDKAITYSQRSKEEAHDYRYFPEPDIPPFRWNEKYLDKIRSTIPELPDEKLARFMKDFALSDYDASLLTDTAEKAEYFEKAVKEGIEGKDGHEGIEAKKIANWIINKRVDIANVSPEQLVLLIKQKIQTVQIEDRELENIVKKVLENNSKAVEDFNKGKKSVLMFLVGQVMRETRGKADPEKLKALISSLM